LAAGHGVVPPIGVAQNGVDPERGFEARQGARPIVCRNDPIPDPRSRHVAAEENDHVGFEVVGCGNDVLDPRQRHVGLAGVQIGDDRDPQPQARRPAGRREGIGLQAQEKARLDREGVAADEPEGRPQNPLQDYAATQEAHAEVPSGRGAPRSTTTTSGGTPNRTGRMLVPSPPDTIRWRSSSTTWP